MRRNPVWAWALVALAAACGPKETTRLDRGAGPAPPPPPDWRRIEPPGLAVSFSAPRDWMTLDEIRELETHEAGNTLQGLPSGQGVPEGLAPGSPLLPTTSGAGPQKGAFELYKRGVIGEVLTPTRISLVKRKAPDGTTLKAAADTAASRFRNPARVTLSLPIGPAEEIRAKVKTRDGETGTHCVYVLVDGEDVYELSLQTEQTEDTVLSIARPVVESFRLGS